MRPKLYLIFSLVLILFGIFVSIIFPVAWYFTTYSHYTYHSIQKGSKFIYNMTYIIMAQPLSNIKNSTYMAIIKSNSGMFNLSICIKDLGNNSFRIKVTAIPPKNFLDYINTTFPSTYTTILNSSSKTLQTFVVLNKSAKSKLAGIFPVSSLGGIFFKYYTVSPDGYAPNTYVKTSNGFYALGTTATESSAMVIHHIDPLLSNFIYTNKAYSYPNATAFYTIALVYTNTAPSVNWSWLFLQYFDFAAPINFILIVAGIALLIYYFRKG
ncbi:hypothetical protein SJAV_18570 [Sulfurisphaera javensis]|uniref:Uncharacterized protein n=1 Tax=Sulfurisphaera javensis TaxID=2049879 RepID=A0AAT9GSX5_9CREN